ASHAEGFCRLVFSTNSGGLVPAGNAKNDKSVGSAKHVEVVKLPECKVRGEGEFLRQFVTMHDWGVDELSGLQEPGAALLSEQEPSAHYQRVRVGVGAGEINHTVAPFGKPRCFMANGLNSISHIPSFSG